LVVEALEGVTVAAKAVVRVVKSVEEKVVVTAVAWVETMAVPEEEVKRVEVEKAEVEMAVVGRGVERAVGRVVERVVAMVGEVMAAAATAVEMEDVDRVGWRSVQNQRT
jgi:hypothetical protein